MVSESAFRRRDQRLPKSGKAASEHDKLRVQQRDRCRDPCSKPLSELRNQRARHRVPVREGVSNGFARPARRCDSRLQVFTNIALRWDIWSPSTWLSLGLKGSLGVASQRPSAGKGFNASAVATGAHRPVELHRNVTEFKRQARRATQELTANNRAAPQSGSKRHHQHVIHTSPSAVTPLRPRRRVGIVVHHGGQPGRLLKERAQGQVVIGVVGRPTDMPRRPLHKTRGTDTDCHNALMFGAQIADRRAQRLPGVCARSIPPPWIPKRARGVNDRGGELGASNVEADGEGDRHSSPRTGGGAGGTKRTTKTPSRRTAEMMSSERSV